MRNRDKGAALVVAMVAIIAVAGMATALINMASTRSRSARDRLDQFRAFQAAQAAVDLSFARIGAVLANANTDFPTKLQSVDGVDFGDQFLADPRIGGLNSASGNVSTDVSGNDTYRFSGEDGDTEYFAVVDPVAGNPLLVGTDKYHLYRIVGAARVVSGTSVREGGERVLEMIIRLKEPPPAVNNPNPTYDAEAGLVCGGNLRISGNPDIVGLKGNLHVNGDAEISGNPTISGDLVAHGSISISGGPAIGSQQANAPEVPIPQIDPTKLLANRRSEIDYILGNDGKVYDNNMNLIADIYGGGGDFNGWTYSGDPTKPADENEWSLSGNSTVDGTYYFETNIQVSGNPTHGQGNDKWGVQTTWITEQSAKLSGSPWVAEAAMGDYFLVAGGDLMASGNGTWGGNGKQGWMLAHEQMYISGNPNFYGAMVAEDAADSQLQQWVKRTDDNFGGGNPYWQYDGGLSISDFSVTGAPPPPPVGVAEPAVVVLWRER